MGVVNGQSEERLDKELEEVESVRRRQESRRQGDASGGRKSKRRKLTKLVGWGEPQEDVPNNIFCFEVSNEPGVSSTGSGIGS